MSVTARELRAESRRTVAGPARPPARAERALAAVRMVMGAWFAKGVVTKLSLVLLGGFLPLPAASGRWHGVMPKLLSKYIATTPFPWYHDFVTNVVLPHSALFAQLTAFGETAVGLGLLLGLATPVAAVVGLLLVLNYGIATMGAGSSNVGFHLMLATGMLAVLFGGAWRVWSLDGWIAGRRRGRWWF